MAEEAGDDDFGDVRSVGTPTAHTHHSVRRGKIQTSQEGEFWFQKTLAMEDKIVERESIERERGGGLSDLSGEDDFGGGDYYISIIKKEERGGRVDKLILQ